MKKLVRNNIPEIIKKESRNENFYVASDSEYYQELIKKLDEETKEFFESHDVEELADILEVVYTIAKFKGIEVKELENIRIDKANKKGSFDKKYIWEN